MEREQLGGFLKAEHMETTLVNYISTSRRQQVGPPA